VDDTLLGEDRKGVWPVQIDSGSMKIPIATFSPQPYLNLLSCFKNGCKKDQK